MKKTKFIQFVLVFALLAFYVLPVSAQILYVRNANETQSVYSLSSISKLSFLVVMLLYIKPTTAQ